VPPNRNLLRIPSPLVTVTLMAVAIDLGEVVWVVRGLGDAFSLSGCAERLETTVDELGYDTAEELLGATADHVIDEAIHHHPDTTHAGTCALLWAICERYLLAPQLGRYMSSHQWRTKAGRRLTQHLGGQSVEVDLVLGLMTAWWEPMIDPSNIVADPATGRPVDLGRVLAQHQSAIGRFDGRHFAEADDELRLWCIYSAVEALLVRD
jgi:hypothetical protein